MKTKVITLLVAAFTVVNLLAQDEKQWHLGLSFSPDYCSRNISQHGTDTMSGFDQRMEQRSKHEESTPGYTTGIWVKYRKNATWEFESGLQYANRGYTYHHTGLVFGDQVSPTQTPVPSDYFRIHHFKYLDIPFKANAILVSHERVNMHVSGGFALNIFMEQKNVFFITNSSEAEQITYGNPNYDNKRVNISPFIGFGPEIRMGKAMRLCIEPTFRYGLIPVHQGDPVHTKLWSFGINAILYIPL